MKSIYFYYVFAFILMLSGYLLFNGFNVSNVVFSELLINSLFIMLVSCFTIICVVYIATRKRRLSNKDVKTIRQYYEFKSAR